MRYLIATSEHPIGAMYQDEIFEEKDLPSDWPGSLPVSGARSARMVSIPRDCSGSTSSPRSSSSSSANLKNSWQIHEELLANAEDVFQGLGLPYRVVNICTGDIGTVAAKKYDIEAWMPRENAYKEVVSCSNCTAYQAVRLNIRVRDKSDFESKQWVHTLNSTAIATSRVLRAILETTSNRTGR